MAGASTSYLLFSGFERHQVAAFCFDMLFMTFFEPAARAHAALR
jgi:hypothetical protein